MINLLPKAIVFDWDNTLVNTGPVIAESLNAVRAAFGLETWSEAEARVKSVRALRESFPEWFGKDWEKARDLYYKNFAAIHCERLVPMSGAEGLLGFLNDRKIPLFVVSNKRSDYLRAEAAHLNWGRFFVRLVGAGEASRDKPSREPVDLALSAGGLKADDSKIWLVGDTHADLECAVRAGITPVFIHDSRAAQRFGVKTFFSDCHTMKTALYNLSR